VCDDDGMEDWECPRCHAKNPPVSEHTTKGFTGAPCYITTFECCGHVEADMSQDNLGWVK
jgi:hypothetical protein